MNLIVVDRNAEDMLYATLVAEECRLSSSHEKIPDIVYLQCRFFHIALTPKVDDIKALLSDIVCERCVLYMCADGDVIIQWSSGTPGLQEIITKKITDAYKESISQYMGDDDFFISYDFANTRSKLKGECSRKLGKQSTNGLKLASYFSNENLISALRTALHLVKMTRAMRVTPVMLIVEDQIFSQKILTSILKEYTCVVANGSAEALLMYMEKCPDIVFLDIDLPDLSGHNFAKLLNKIDDDVYIVMVSGNQYMDDIKTAQQNNVKGFIGKPYEKSAILKVVEQFKKKKETLVTSQPPVDLTNLRKSIGEDKDLEKELFDEFSSSSIDIVNELGRLSDAGSGGNEAWRKASHALKGTAANLGAFRLADLCKLAQEKFEADPQSKTSLLAEIRAECLLVNAYLSTQA